MVIAKHRFDGVSVVAGQVLEMIHFEFGLAIEPEPVSSSGLLPPLIVAFQL